jgi:hypothetical protein
MRASVGLLQSRKGRWDLEDHGGNPYTVKPRILRQMSCRCDGFVLLPEILGQ